VLQEKKTSDELLQSSHQQRSERDKERKKTCEKTGEANDTGEQNNPTSRFFTPQMQKLEKKPPFHKVSL